MYDMITATDTYLIGVLGSQGKNMKSSHVHFALWAANIRLFKVKQTVK